MSTCLHPRTASIAADPVSPLVAPMIITCSSRSASTCSKSRPTSCNAMSLNASVGPWNNSSSHSVSSIWTSGATAGWRNVAYAVVADAIEDDPVDLALHERPHHGGGDVGVVAQPGQVGQGRPLGGHVQPAVDGEPGEQHVGETELGRRAARRHVLHVSRRSRAAARRCGGPRRGRAAPARSPARRPRAPHG